MNTNTQFYHLHQESGPPPPSRYYLEDTTSSELINNNNNNNNQVVKGKRKRASSQQLKVLNRVFATTSFPSTEVRNQLAAELAMTPRTVQIWFQNKRQASRQKDGHHSRNTKSIARLSASPPSGNKDLMMLVAAATSAQPATTTATKPQNSLSPTWSDDSCRTAVPNTASGKQPLAPHTINDRWLYDSTPAKLDYLYSHNSQVVRVSPTSPASSSTINNMWTKYHYLSPPPPPPPPLPPISTSDNNAQQRSMSLMEVLNAPPEKRKLPPPLSSSQLK